VAREKQNNSATLRRSILKVLLFSLAGIVAVGLVFSLYFLQADPFSLEERSIGSNLSFFALINLLIIALLIVAFLVIRNLVKLVLDRKRKILGARLR
jgi:two-component system, NtrC family, nitrogen regulation sensor histidine kinase NtrY